MWRVDAGERAGRERGGAASRRRDIHRRAAAALGLYSPRRAEAPGAAARSVSPHIIFPFTSSLVPLCKTRIRSLHLSTSNPFVSVRRFWQASSLEGYIGRRCLSTVNHESNTTTGSRICVITHPTLRVTILIHLVSAVRAD